VADVARKLGDRIPARILGRRLHVLCRVSRVGGSVGGSGLR
jgi:hypothetical protein